MKIDKDKEWLDAQEVMFILNISARTLQFYRDNSKIPFSKFNGKFFYKRSDIETILNQNYNKPKIT